MSNRILFSVAVLIALISISSCKEKEKEVEVQEPATATIQVHFDVKWMSDDFVMQQVYNDAFGNRVRVDKFINYVSMLKLVKEDGSEVSLADFLLVNYIVDNTYSFDVPAAKYNALRFGLGIPEDYNKDQDPAQYPSSSVLSVAGSQGMFWTWNTGYIFSKFEAKVDTSGTEGAELLWPVAIHAGNDTCYRACEFGLPNFEIEANGSKVINVHTSVDQILAAGGDDDIDLATDAVTHTSSNTTLAITFMDNYVNAIVVEQ